MSMSNNIFCELNACFINDLNDIFNGDEQISLLDINKRTLAFANFINGVDSFPICLGLYDGSDKSIFKIFNAFLSLFSKEQLIKKLNEVQKNRLGKKSVRELFCIVANNYLKAMAYAEDNNISYRKLILELEVEIKNISFYEDKFSNCRKIYNVNNSKEEYNLPLIYIHYRT